MNNSKYFYEDGKITRCDGMENKCGTHITRELLASLNGAKFAAQIDLSNQVAKHETAIKELTIKLREIENLEEADIESCYEFSGSY